MGKEAPDPWAFEKKAWQKGFQAVAGVDEAGRGPLAGPVVAAACILPRGSVSLFSEIADSKQLTSKKREQLFSLLTSAEGVFFGLGIVAAERIDEINIYQATIEAMQLAAQKLSLLFDYLLVDGLQLPYDQVPVEKVIRGDTLSRSIGAASILAKVTRDRLMIEADGKYPEYGFSKHKGYGTRVHLEALRRFGPCPLHRKSFQPVKESLASVLTAPQQWCLR